MILEKRIPLKYIINKIRYDLVLIICIGLAANLFTGRFHFWLPDMPIGIPTFLGTAISVLLSFKMNQSYDRWWEARKVWGAIVNDSRSFVVQLKALVKDDLDSIRTIAYRQIAWCYCLGRSLRAQDPTETISHLISPADMSEITKHNNKALALLQLNSTDLKRLKTAEQVDSFGHMQLNDTLVRLCDAMGKAERINNTVFPSTYRKFLHFIIYLFVITLSIALKDIDRPFVMLLLIFISAAFFLIEKSAYHLQDPFRNRPSDISVTAIATTIDINIRQLLGDEEVPEPTKPEAFYLM